MNKSCLKHSWICQDHVDENKPLFAAHYKEFNTKDQQIPPPASASHTLNQPCTAYPSAANLRSRGRSTAQKARIIDTNTSIEENDDIPNMGLPPDEIMARLKNRTPAGDTLITPRSSFSAAYWGGTG